MFDIKRERGERSHEFSSLPCVIIPYCDYVYIY